MSNRLSFWIGSDQGTKGQSMSVLLSCPGQIEKIYQVATFHSVTGAPLLYFVRVLGIVFRHISYIQCQCQTNCCLFRKMKLSCTALILIDNLYYFDVLCLCLQWILQAYCWRLCASACNVRSVMLRGDYMYALISQTHQRLNLLFTYCIFFTAWWLGW